MMSCWLKVIEFGPSGVVVASNCCGTADFIPTSDNKSSYVCCDRRIKANAENILKSKNEMDEKHTNHDRDNWQLRSMYLFQCHIFRPCWYLDYIPLLPKENLQYSPKWYDDGHFSNQRGYGKCDHHNYYTNWYDYFYSFVKLLPLACTFLSVRKT